MVLHGERKAKPVAQKTQIGTPEVAVVGRRLRRLRRERGLTQAELARQIGIQQSDLSRMEQGEYRVSLDNLFKILGVFDLDLAEFFGEQQATAEQQRQSLSREDMKILHLLRELSPEGRAEVQEFLEFKLRKERQERRSLRARSSGENGS
jgi:transcriptional regulator with XRE-family HTH domain